MTEYLVPLTEPIAKLIEAVRSATGILYEPTRIRRKAKSEADALIIKTKGELIARELAQRAAARLSHIELRRQRNLESIVDSAFDFLPDKVSDERPNEDWLVQFFEFAQGIGDDEVQKIWAKILAGEITRMGTFSLRTLQTLRALSRDDASLFQSYASHFFHLVREEQETAHQVVPRDPTGPRRVVDSSVEVKIRCKYVMPLFQKVPRYLESKEFSRDDLTHLQSLGLVHHAREAFEVGTGRKWFLTQSGKHFTLEDWSAVRGTQKYEVQTLTAVGCELAQIIERDVPGEYLAVVKDAAEAHHQVFREEQSEEEAHT